MSSCMVCGENQEMPYTCSYCRETLCSDHRLPKAHRCAGLRDAEKKNREDKLGEYADVVEPLSNESEKGRVAQAIHRISRAFDRD